MLLNTFPFLVFFVFVFVLYWKIYKKGQWLILLLASYYFFGSWKPAYLGLILLTTVINYFSAQAICRFPKRKKQLLVLALLFDLGVLFFFKYLNFFTYSLDQFTNLWHLKVYLPQFKLLLPIGISFYTFQTIGYMLDVYKGKVKPEKHLGYFALFVCFFPQLSAGPIERAGELLPQLKKTHHYEYLQVVSGLKLFSFGLFKKLVIADNLAIVVDRVFNSLPNYQGFSLVVAVLLFSWQIYADFSGYTDMSRGVARMFGIELVENFNSPYLATSVRDFWRRWHMSLSRWFMDFVYIPLGGSRKGLSRTCINILIVFMIVGIWHGAAWNFVVWGAFHGILMAMERLSSKLFGNRIRLPILLKIAYTYSMVSFSWIFFRANNFTDAVYVIEHGVVGLKSYINFNYLWATLNQLFITNKIEMLITFGLFLTAICIEVISNRTSLGQIIKKQPAVIRYIIYVFLILTIVHLRNANIKEFIYVRF